MNNLFVRFLTAFMPSSKMRKKFRSKYLNNQQGGQLPPPGCFSSHNIKDKTLIKCLNKLIANRNKPKNLELMQNLNGFFSQENIQTLNNYILNKIPKNVVKVTVNNLKYKYCDKDILFITDLPADDYGCKTIGIDEIKNYDDKYVFLVGFNKDFLGFEAVKKISDLGLKYEVILLGMPASKYYHTDKHAYYALLDEWNRPDRKGHFCAVDFENIFQAIKQTKDLEGDFVEIGTYQGASARAALNYMQKSGIKRKSYFLDTYEGFTYEEAQNSQDALWKNSHTETSQEAVKEFLSEYDNANVVKSNIIRDELPQEIEKIVVANIDVDMYDAVKAALYKVKYKIVKNGFILAEDYGHTPALIGAYKAVTEFIEENPNEFICILSSGGQMIMIKR